MDGDWGHCARGRAHLSGRMIHRTHRQRIPVKLFAVLALIDVVVLVAEKTAALHAAGAPTSFYVGLMHQPWLWLSLALGPIQLGVWTKILTHTDLSLAYPLSSVSYPLTMLAACVVFGERLSPLVWCGGLLITLGLILVGSQRVDRGNPMPSVHL